MLLVSGVGLILLTLANRLNHAIDRVRVLDHEVETAAPEHRADKLLQLDLIFQRCRLLQASIVSVSASILSSALIILCLFGHYFWEKPLQPVVMALFAVSLLFMIAAMVFLILDVSRNLAALRIEVRPHLPGV